MMKACIESKRDFSINAMDPSSEGSLLETILIWVSWNINMCTKWYQQKWAKWNVDDRLIALFWINVLTIQLNCVSKMKCYHGLEGYSLV